MSKKTHQRVDGRLLQMNKPFSQLKGTQRLKISQWLYEECRARYLKSGQFPDARYNREILDCVYEKIREAEIWIPFVELQKYFYSKKSSFRKRCDKEHTSENDIH